MTFICSIFCIEYGIGSTYMYWYIFRCTFQRHCLFSITDLTCGRKFTYNIFLSDKNSESGNYYFSLYRWESWCMKLLARAVIIRYHKLGGLSNRNLFSLVLKVGCMKARWEQIVCSWSLFPWLAEVCFFAMSPYDLPTVYVHS